MNPILLDLVRDPATVAKFWDRVEKTPTCWNWTGAIGRAAGYSLFSPCRAYRGKWLWTGRTDAKGYGRVGFLKRPNVGAHRVSWALTHGGDLPDRWVLHRCDNPPCVNPDHLFLGDVLDNNRDRQEKGRTRGWAGATEERHHAFKVTTDLTARMVAMRQTGATQQAIADATGVSRGHVSKILRGQTVASRKVA